MKKLKELMISDVIRTFANTPTALHYDLFKATSSPEALKEASTDLAAKVPSDVSVIVAPGLGAAGLAASVAMAFLPRVVAVLNVRDPAKTREGESIVQGSIPTEASNAVFIDDTITTGETFRQTIDALKKSAPTVTITCCALLYDSWTIGSRRIRASGVPMYSSLRRHDVGLTRDEVSNTLGVNAVKTPALTKKLYEFRAAKLDREKPKSAPLLLDDRIITADGTHTLRANTYDGQELWSWQGSNPRSKGIMQDLQLQADGTLLIASYSGAVAKLTTDGAQLWETPICNSIHSTPRVDSDGIIYVACEEFDRTTRQPGGSLVKLSHDGKVIQKQRYSNDYAPARCTVLDNSIIVTANDDIVRSLSKADFTVQNWQTELPGKVRGEILYDSGKLYCATESGHVVSLDAGTGAILWSNRTSRNFYHALPRMSGNRVVFTDSSHYAHAINVDTGKREWIARFRSRVRHRPTIITTNQWMFCGIDGDVHIVDPTDGSKIAQTRTGRKLMQPASYFNGKVGLMTGNGTVQIWEMNNDLHS